MRRFWLMVMILAAALARAGALEDLTERDASSGLKAALERGAVAAVDKLGRENGFSGNDKVRIGLPAGLDKARPLLQLSGRGRQLDELEAAMNRAAETAVPLAKPLLLDAVRSMSVTDAKNILTGGDTAVTDFFRAKTADKLATRFLPIVKQVTDRTDLAARYNSAFSVVGKLGIAPQQASVEGYVTQQALNGLFAMIAEEERSIRRDPLGSGSAIISRVFGALMR